MILGSKFLTTQEKTKPKRRGDVHAILGQTLVIGNGSCEFLTNLVYNCVRTSEKSKAFINPKDLLYNALSETKVSGSCSALIVTFNERVCEI